MKSKTTAVALFFLLSPFGSPSWAAPSAIPESALTEGALISALARGASASAAASSAAAASDDAGFGLGRSIKISPKYPESSAKPADARPADMSEHSAPILLTFETNSAALTASAKRALAVVSRALNSDSLKQEHFIIEGHADPRGKPERNLQLSQERAEAVRAYLVVVGEIEVSRLKTIGKGDREPMNADDPSSPDNRRVTFVTMP